MPLLWDGGSRDPGRWFPVGDGGAHAAMLCATLAPPQAGEGTTSPVPHQGEIAMTMTFARIRILLVALALAASAAVSLAQSQAAQGAAATETSPRTPPERIDRPVPGAAGADTSGTAQASPRKPMHPVVKDARLVASPKVRYLGPPGTTSPFGSTNMTENQCRDMERCQVVQGQGPSYATWCRCGKGKLTTFTYIHD
jgi:hypothetical protein